MGQLADMLAEGGGADGEPPAEDSGDGDTKKMAEASVKAFFEAGKAGDFALAADHLASAMEHCEAYADDSEPKDGAGEGGHAVLVIPHKG